jgi:hypothetical protein
VTYFHFLSHHKVLRKLLDPPHKIIKLF